MRWVCAGPVATRPNGPATAARSSPPVLPARPVVNDLLTLWDSIAAEQSGPELTDADRQLIDQRLESFLADGDPGIDADAALDAIEQSL